MRRLLLCLGLCLVVGNDRVGPRHVVPRATIHVVRSHPATPGARPTGAEFAALAQANRPVDCLKAAVARYRNDVQVLHAKLSKQERLGTKLNPAEVIDVWYRTEPHSVMMKWESKPVGKAQQIVYVDGANDNKMLVKPKGFLAVAGVVPTDPEGGEAKAGSRQTIRKSGPLKAAEEALTKWAAAEERGELQVEYLGVKEYAEAGSRPCHVFRRTIAKPDDDAVASAEIALDADSWIQVASLLKNARGELLGAYYFHVVAVNPQLPAGLFERASLK